MQMEMWTLKSNDNLSFKNIFGNLSNCSSKYNNGELNFFYFILKGFVLYCIEESHVDEGIRFGKNFKLIMLMDKNRVMQNHLKVEFKFTSNEVFVEPN